MSDLLIDNKAARGVVKTLGLPIPLPQPLLRQDGPWTAAPLQGTAVLAGLSHGASLGNALGATLTGTGADVYVQAPEGERAAFDAGADGKAIELDLDKLPDSTPVQALVFDASGLEAPESLKELHAFFHPLIRALAPNGRAVVLARSVESSDDPVVRATRRAIEGFVRSLAKEIGRKGATAQTLYVDPGVDERLAPVLRFVLGRGSAYISGQPLHVTGYAASPGDAPTEQPLAGKVALVTGAARGIGAATAEALAREGATVVVMDVPQAEDAARKVAEKIGGSALACDVTAENAAETIQTHVRDHHGGLDIVVHNAGITRDKTLGRMSEEQWDLVLAVNLAGLIRTNEALLDTLRDGGRIIGLSSIGGIAGNVGQTNYGATKAGVIGYVQGLAPRVAERGITVNAVAPGFIETKMTAAMPFATREVARRLCNLSQGGQPQDIAEAITFLASPGAAGLTGAVLRVCGGSLLGA